MRNLIYVHNFVQKIKRPTSQTTLHLLSVHFLHKLRFPLVISTTHTKLRKKINVCHPPLKTIALFVPIYVTIIFLSLFEYNPLYLSGVSRKMAAFGNVAAPPSGRFCIRRSPIDRLSLPEQWHSFRMKIMKSKKRIQVVGYILRNKSVVLFYFYMVHLKP